ncbi:MAG: DCC1-like thiol-disulfide oxidoreductase family protein [Pseudomonadota bacterium]
MAIQIYYDGDCPFCANYVKLLRIREGYGDVTLINLRDDDDARKELQCEGFDLDEGMVVDTGDRRLGGADAANALAMMSSGSDLLNRMNRMFLGSRALSAIVYPVLRSGRWLTLFLLGRKGIGEPDPGTTARLEVFSILFALFSLFHFFNYAFEYNRFPPQWDQFAILVTAIWLFVRPGSGRALFFLVLASSISTYVQAPAQSNHTMVRTAVLLGYWASFIYTMIRGRRWSDIFGNFAVAGQGALLVMYFFGIFHKLNDDFLNPISSCAIALWNQMPPPLSSVQHPLMDHAAIYGTFVVEGMLIVALLLPRYRHYGITFGILFHLLLAFSNYAMYIAFTSLSISLHALFLNGDAAQRIMASPEMAWIKSRVRNPIYIFLFATIVAALIFAADAGNYSLVTLIVCPLILPFCYLVIRYGASNKPLLKAGNRRPALTIGIVVTTLFFANGWMPYLGLKSAQVISMFSNLRLEAGVSNHLIMPRPGPFTYLDDVAVIQEDGGSPFLAWHKTDEISIVYYDLLAHLDQFPNVTPSFSVTGRQFDNVSASELQDEIDQTLHGPIFRKWFHFQPVDLKRPEMCGF